VTNGEKKVSRLAKRDLPRRQNQSNQTTHPPSGHQSLPPPPQPCLALTIKAANRASHPLFFLHHLLAINHLLWLAFRVSHPSSLTPASHNNGSSHIASATMATTAMDYESTNPDRFEDDGPRYDRQRSASPRGARDDDGGRRRSASPIGDSDLRAPKDGNSSKDDDESINPGSNLFVTGISPSLSEEEVTRLFQKYGDVEKCQIMRDPHSKESRGFGFVKMVTSEQADNARDGLNGEMLEGRSLSIEKARRARPRTPTPGKYFGPPKRDPRPGGRFDRYDDRRRGYGGGYGGGGYRDDPYRYRGGGDRREHDRGYDRGYERSYDRGYDRDHDRRDYDRGYDRRDRDEGYSRGPGGGDRYGGSGGGRGGGGDRGGDRERYSGPPRGGSNYDRSYDRDRGYERDGPRSRDPPASSSYADAGPRSDAREPYGGSHY
jgi:transformer-2 protein